MFAKIAPLARLPRNLQTLDYQIPENTTLSPGQIVRVYLRNKKVLGVILSTSNSHHLRKGINIKTIDEIITPNSIISEQTIKLAQWISLYYATALGIVLGSFMPINTLRFLKKIPKAQHKAVTKIQPQKPTLIHYSKYSERFEKYREIIIKSKGQVLIIVPELFLINEWENNLLKELNIPYSIYTGTLTRVKQQNAWTDIQSGKSKIIIGTRFTIFAPLLDVQTIIVDDEQNPFHKQEEPNPRFHIRETAEQLAILNNATLYFGSDCSSMQAWENVNSGKWVEEGKNKNKPPMLNVLDLADGWPLTADLKVAIINTLRENKRVFLFINKLGDARIVSCNGCAYEFSCDKCRIAFSYHSTTNHLVCHSCGFSEPLPAVCPKCSGSKFSKKGIGTETLEKKMKESWPDYGVLRIDSTVKEFHSNDNIIIGTQFALPLLPYSSIGLIGIINFEQLASKASYLANEQTFCLIRRLQQYNIPLFIQAFNTKHPLLKSLKNPDEEFIVQELKERKVFNWPPYSTIIKIIIMDKDKKRAENKAKKIASCIEEFDVNPVASLYPPFVRGNYRYGFIIKAPADFDQKKSDLFSKIPNDCIIDVNPIKI